MLSMYHDYRIFNPSRGYLCLNELDLGIHLKPAMSSIFRQKLVPQVYTQLVLEAKRFSGTEAHAAGIVEGLGGLEDALKFIGERKLTEKSKTGVLGSLKVEMWRETVAYIETLEGEEEKFLAWNNQEDARMEDGRARVKQWEQNVAKPKL